MDESEDNYHPIGDDLNDDTEEKPSSDTYITEMSDVIIDAPIVVDQ